MNMANTGNENQRAGAPSGLNVGLCNNLKSIREKCGYSLQELGDMCGRSKGLMWELEKPSANPTLKTAYALSRVLGVEVTDIWPNTVEIVEETITVRRVVHNAKLTG
jgi:DNA-binding XRE family transcriptional regulator